MRSQIGKPLLNLIQVSPWTWRTLRLIALCLIWTSIQSMLPLPPAMAKSPAVILTGSIQKWRGNRQPGPGLGPNPLVAVGQEVIAVQGRIFPSQLGDPFLPSSQLRTPVLSRAPSNTNGQFQLVIPTEGTIQREVTLLLVVPGGYYLNRFDSSGSFATVQLPHPHQQPIVLIDDRGTVF
jgi:hypothetical protein